MVPRNAANAIALTPVVTKTPTNERITYIFRGSPRAQFLPHAKYPPSPRSPPIQARREDRQ